ncbi:MAG TPA: hypothetical protein VER55_16465 [Ardenticatenaceae bacterium]|nr:hypothetical protein [Ardenticatenaceae bacterium]
MVRRLRDTGTPGFPRNSRLLLYVGYVLLTVCIMHWYLVSHHIELQTPQTSRTFAAFRLFGLPLDYLVLVDGGERLLLE